MNHGGKPYCKDDAWKKTNYFLQEKNTRLTYILGADCLIHTD